jgi:hypothetical protein
MNQVIDLAAARRRREVRQALTDIERDRRMLAALMGQRKALAEALQAVDLAVAAVYGARYAWGEVTL